MKIMTYINNFLLFVIKVGLIPIKKSQTGSFGTKKFTQYIEPQNDETNKMTCAPTEDSDQPGPTPRLIRVFAVRMKKH